MRPASQFVEVAPGYIVATECLVRVEIGEASICWWLIDGSENEYGFGDMDPATRWYEGVRRSLGAHIGIDEP